MAEIDSLEISIQSNIDKVNKNMDLLIKKMGIVAQGISAIGSNKGLEEFTKKAQSISSDMGKIGKSVSQSVKPIEEQAKKITKSVEEIIKEANKKTMDLTPKLNMDNLSAEAKKYENQLRNMQNQLNKVLAMPSAEKQERTIERIIANTNEAKNALKKIEELKINIKAGGIEETQKNIEKFVEESLERFKNVSPSLDFQHTEKELEKYKKQFRNTQNELIYMMENPPEIVSGKELKNLEKIVQKYSEANNAIKELQERQIKDWMAPLEADVHIPEIVSTTEGNMGSVLAKIPDALFIANKSIDDTREKIESLSETFKESGKDFVFEGNAEQLEKQIQKVGAELDGLFKRQDKMIELGKVNTEPFKNLIRDIENARNRLEILENARPEALNRTLQENAEKARLAAEQLKVFEGNLGKLQIPPVDETNLKKLQTALKKTEADLEKLRLKLANGLALGKISANIDDSGYRNLREQIALTEKQAEALREKMGNIGVFERLKQSMSGASSSSKKLQKSISALYASLKKISNGIKSVLSKIGSLIKSMLLLGHATKKSNGGFNVGLKTILKYGFGIRSLYVLVNKLRSAIKEGMKNLIQYSDQTNQSVSMLSSSMSQFKNASAAAFAPILNAIAPVLNQLIQLFIRATNAVNQFFSALTGHGTWIKAKYNFEDVADKISGAADAAKGALQPFDKLNNLTTQKGAGAGGIEPGDMFETVPVEDKFKDLAKKIKDIAKKLFKPIKEAWDREGKFVMNSWKYALDEVWKLIKDIGRDFLIVWQQPETVDMLADILHIIGDIGLIVGHLARNFREAWNENETGLHILENIRDIIAAIIHNIRLAADFTVEWADKLNFSPILQAIERFTKSLIPVVDALSGVLMDFYTMVLLPLAKWTIEKGLPELLDVFTAFNEKVDWKKLRDNIAEFWKHLEPFAETVGEGLIIFIERVSDAIANFINSETFVNFLHAVEDWMDSVTPEDVAKGIERLVEALIGLKLAFLGFQAISAVTGVLTTIKTFLSFFGVGGAGSTVAKGIGETTTALGGLSGALAGLAVVGTSYFALDQLTEHLEELAKATGTSTDQAKRLEERYDGFGGKMTALSDGFNMAKNGIQGYGFAADNVTGTGIALEKAMEEIADGAILTDKHMAELQNRFSLTDEDMEMLRQEMLDVNPTLREIADNLGFENASAETLQDIAEGFASISNGMQPLPEEMFNMTEDARNFINEVRNSEEPLKIYGEKLSGIGTEAENASGKINLAAQNIANGVSKNLENTTNTMNSSLQNMNSSWTKMWNSLPGATSTALNIAKGSIRSFSQEALSMIRDVSGSIASIGRTIGISALKTKTYSTKKASVKGYATGGFPEDGWFRASKGEYFGSFDDGTSYIANNNQIEGGISSGVEQAAYRGMMRALKESGGIGGSQNVNVTIEGEMSNFFRAFKSEYHSEVERRGLTSVDPILGH